MMPPTRTGDEPFSERSIADLKKKYSEEMKDADDNPIKICMDLIFHAATERDPLKRHEVSFRLSRFLMEPDGLVNLFLAVIDFDASSQKRTTHHQRFQAVGNIIACLPKLSTSYEQYCECIVNQLKPLLVHSIARYATLASIIINALVESPHSKKHEQQQAIENVILKPIFEPLSQSDLSQDDPKVSNSVMAVRNLLQNHLPVKLFLPVFPNLLYCLLRLHKTPSHLKVSLRQSIVDILTGLEVGPACCLLDQTMMDDPRFQYKSEIAVEGGNFSLKPSEVDGSDPSAVDKLVLEILDDCKDDSIMFEFFFQFQAKMLTATDMDRAVRYANLVQPFLCKILKGQIGDRTRRKSGLSLGFVTRILANHLEKFLGASKGDANIDPNAPSLTTYIDILEVMCSADFLGESDYFYSRTLPVLRELKSTLTANPGVIEDKTLLQSLSAFLSRIKTDRAGSHSGKSERHVDPIQKEHDSILRDLNDELVPVRVHALIRLKQLVMANDKLTVAKIPQLCSVVESALADQESYVFLAGINLMAEMAFRRTDDILPKLIEMHARPDMDTLQRINVGEVLARLSRRLNKTTPHYAMQIISGLLKSSEDQDEHVRVSSLTNIGLVAANLGASLDKYIVDILACIGRVLEADTVQVKCAAVDLLRTALMGLDKMNARSIQRELKSIYRTLKELKFRTLDEKLCLQVELALDELDRLAKDMLGLGEHRDRESLVKNIQVLSLLD